MTVMMVGNNNNNNSVGHDKDDNVVVTVSSRFQGVDQKSCLVSGCARSLCLGVLVSLIIILASIKSLGPDEQIVFTDGQDKSVKNGPATLIVLPWKDAETRKATHLEAHQYAVVQHTRTKAIRH